MKAAELLVDGKAISLGKRIGKGGEGEVYALNDGTKRALKFYTVKDLAQREAKIHAMLQSRLSEKSSFVAFPLAIAKYKDGRFAGFLMNLVDGHKPLHELYSPVGRKVNFPQADYRFLVRSAANIARAVASVHSSGCVIGDINHSGILVSSSATAVLIDADSFQVMVGSQKFLCKVGVPEYTPPELQGQKLDSVVRTSNHDSFGLAVVIFQLLFMGRHPFSGSFKGSGDMQLERAIAEYRFAYSIVNACGMTPPPGAAVLQDFPKNIATSFERSFSQASVNSRTTAEQWVSLLQELEKTLRSCPVNKMHFYSSTAAECPWCRMDRALGMFTFLPSFSSSSNQGPSLAFNLAAVWSDIDQILSVQQISYKPILPTLALEPSVQANQIRTAGRRRQALGVVSLLFCISIVIGYPASWWIVIPLTLWGLSAVTNHFDVSAETLGEYATCQKQWLTAHHEWQKRCGILELMSLRLSLSEAKENLEDLAKERNDRMSQYQRERRSIQLNEFLESFQIKNAKIPGIGPTRKTTLASYGIETAADVSSDRIQSIQGFGPKTAAPILDWRRTILNKFVYSEQPNATDKRVLQRIAAEIDAKELRSKNILLSGAQALRLVQDKVNAQINLSDPELVELDAERTQLRVDIAYLGGKIPR